MTNKIISPKWSLDDYGKLIYHLFSFSKIVSLNDYEARLPGVWLRHDVELDDQAAIAMAEFEHGQGVSSTYFICFESPYLPLDKAVQVADRIRKLGHDIGIHRLWKRDYSDEFCATIKFSKEEYRRVSFHAPCIDITVQASEEYGKNVYRNIGEKVGLYFSDSTGKWRWGHPFDVSNSGLPIQILTHPFWWSKSDITTSIALVNECNFLPQIIQRSSK